MDNYEFRFVANKDSLECVILAIDAQIGKIVNEKMRNGGLTDEAMNPDSQLTMLKELRAKFKAMHSERYPQKLNLK